MISVDLRHLTWRTSSYSGNTGNCVEVADLPDGACYLRDTKDRQGGVLTFGGNQWTSFVAKIKTGFLDG